MAERRLSDEQLLAELEARYPKQMGVDAPRPKYTVETPEEDDRPISTTPDGRPIFRADYVPYQGRPRKVWPLKGDIIPDHTSSTLKIEQLGINEPAISTFRQVENNSEAESLPLEDVVSESDLSKGLGS